MSSLVEGLSAIHAKSLKQAGIKKKNILHTILIIGMHQWCSMVFNGSGGGWRWGATVNGGGSGRQRSGLLSAVFMSGGSGRFTMVMVMALDGESRQWTVVSSG
jgi:hypothetical protein